MPERYTKYFHLILPHLGIAFIALAMILGHFYNWRGKAVLLTTDKTNVFITKNKEIKIAPFALTLNHFNIEHYATGESKRFDVIIDVEENNTQKSISLSVNHPCKMGFGLDLYVINYDRTNVKNPEWCVVELVYEPFQSVFLGGIILIMVGLILCIFLIPNFLDKSKKSL